MVQILEMVLDRFLPCALPRAGHLPAVDRRQLRDSGWDALHGQPFANWVKAWFFGVGSGFGFALALSGLVGVREKLKHADMPAGLQGLGIRSLESRRC